MINASRLAKTGLPGKAKILEVRDTGVTINNNPQVKLILEVKNSFGQTYSTQCRVLVSRLNPNMYSAGMEIPVKIDPKNEKNVVVDMSGGSSAKYAQPGADVNKLRTELEELQKQQEGLLLSGKKARAIIKNYNWLGANVNGNNPYVELEIEVLPDGGIPFSAKTRGVIGEQAVHKYQPGKEIFVKYDFYDNSKVTIDHAL
jgi:hypothetical protein